MKFLKFTLLNLIVLISVFSCSGDSDTQETEETTILNSSEYYEGLNISYGNDSNQTFDLYLPANRTVNTKTLVLVHGGGWSSGDKSNMAFIVDLIQQDFPNIAIVNLNYRLADANNPPYPMQIDDITSVINHIKDNMKKYTLSTDIGFIGVSAGAHLDLLWSYAFDDNSYVNMACSIVGPTNFTDPAYLSTPGPAVQPLLDLFGIEASTPFLEEISPFHQATTSSPPTILFYAGQDELVPITQGTALRDKLASLNVTHDFTLYPNAGHGLGITEIIDLWAKLKIFINNHL